MIFQLNNDYSYLGKIVGLVFFGFLCNQSNADYESEAAANTRLYAEGTIAGIIDTYAKVEAQPEDVSRFADDLLNGASLESIFLDMREEIPDMAVVEDKMGAFHMITDTYPDPANYISLHQRSIGILGEVTLGENGNEFEDTLEIGVNQIVNSDLELIASGGSLFVEQDFDHFEFTITEPGLFVIFTRDNASSLFGTEMTLFDENGNNIGFDDNSGAGFFSRIETTLEPGTYVVRVEGDFFDTGNYTLVVSSTSTVGFGDDDNDDDHGDSIQTATPILLNSNTFGTLDGQALDDGGLFVRDRDFFAFSLTVEGTVSAYTTVTDFFTDTYIELYDSDGNIILENDDGGVDLNGSVTTTLEPGRYYLNVRGFSLNEVGDYALTLTGPQGADRPALSLEDIPTSLISFASLSLAEPEYSNEFASATALVDEYNDGVNSRREIFSALYENRVEGSPTQIQINQGQNRIFDLGGVSEFVAGFVIDVVFGLQPIIWDVPDTGRADFAAALNVIYKAGESRDRDVLNSEISDISDEQLVTEVLDSPLLEEGKVEFGVLSFVTGGNLSLGWLNSVEYGMLYGTNYPWYYSLDLNEWVFSEANLDGDDWLYVTGLGWGWIPEEEFPYFYSADLNKYIYLEDGFYYDFESDSWVAY
ncbi:MAG: hypothetical protein ACPGN3_04180 [Opitutales bacterium]